MSHITFYFFTCHMSLRQSATTPNASPASHPTMHSRMVSMKEEEEKKLLAMLDNFLTKLQILRPIPFHYSR